MAGESKITSDHETIKKWVEERGGKPATVRGTSGEAETGLLRIDFPGYGAGTKALREISWEEFFQKFDEKNLGFLYQDKTRDGKESRFFKFVGRPKK
ncbi:MAG: hypothetical protein UT63_C0051G0013 [Candidatus Gottesmanbacteria bacterium GW2011_GWC2_39_8]|uniref:1,4-alpha-glucan branching enzyme n=1 Tax=Candidatus Gottesmanbacteria bacterium GW2011_GWC2_39_8 TaxID=1618450 RepID=A0A0G0Q438_9BACT|nr:MAG: hypothetical protein UT63_C0051G0013 [Candidatus Gottesmanbacteria bacterium GW2011_GWC2_39_8]